ncbi:MarR family transcriptional regulator [Paenibacillus sp. N4]|uniref:MarR family winged helix-turn-helix transcriptional regulator n=1 Tax=Paenibacillus vietnamensis TaxID=2590547 RepID=UPI001CD10910|nr:MarR family transcriptional regulator [Paenibacillus vietnamensis]
MHSIQGFPGRDYATVSELAERLQVTHHACVGLVTRCEKSGLIVRRPNPADARSVHITLTENGLALLEKYPRFFYSKFVTFILCCSLIIIPRVTHIK